MSEGNTYTHMYASRYPDAEAVAQCLTGEHESLLRRTLSWQQVIYSDSTLPAWLKASLVNSFHFITETSVWAQALPPVGEWCRPEDGLFATNDSPRYCPQMAFTLCTFYGNLPVVYFFPELAISTLRGFKAYQNDAGDIPYTLGERYEVALPYMEYWMRDSKPMTTLDGPCYAALVDRSWRCSEGDEVLREFYDSVKRNAISTMNLRPGSGAAGVVSMPADNNGWDWYETFLMYGVTPHVGGLHLAQLRIVRRMAEAMDDREFVKQCDEWISQGSEVLERDAWAGTHYMLFNEVETGKKSDVILSNQLDGEWVARFHGLEGVFLSDRVETTLDTLKNTNIALSESGMVVACKPGGQYLGDGDLDTYYWGPRGSHLTGIIPVGIIYMYHGQRQFGLDLIRRAVQSVILSGWYWDWPAMTDGADAPRVGSDCYQNMILWSLPAAMQDEDLAGPCQTGGLVDRVVKAATG